MFLFYESLKKIVSSMGSSTSSCFATLWVVLIIVQIVGANDESSPSTLTSSRVTLTVLTGQLVYLRPQDLNAVNPFPPSESCKTEVISNEPATQIFGQMSPKYFDCDFPYGRVVYEHFGFDPATSFEDRVKLRIVDFSGNVTRFREVDVAVVVKNETNEDRRRRKAIAIVEGPLIVTEFFGLSRPIDHRVLEFRVDSVGTTSCRVRFQFDRGWPRHGRVVSGYERRLLVGEEFAVNSCQEFLYLGLRYEHLRPPTPNVDYIGLLIDIVENGIQRREWIRLKVVIKPALPNVPPKLSESSSLNFHVQYDSFGVNFLHSSVLSAEDDESPPELVVFNLTKGFSPFQGHLFNVADDSRRPLTSFTQYDLLKKNVAYCPPALLYYDRLKFQIRFDILDGDFGMSKTPATVNVVLHRQDSSQNSSSSSSSSFRRPRLTVRMGLVVLEGLSQPLQVDNHLRMTAATSPSTVKIAVIDGPKHGRLFVDGRQLVELQDSTFTWSQLERQLVVYEQDGDDVNSDYIHLKIFGDPDVLKVVLPIDIIPADDSTPHLTVNAGLKVIAGETVIITAESLRAIDSDSPTADITYLITEKPRHGIVFKHFISFPVMNFTQTDIDNGHVFYTNNYVVDKNSSPLRFDKFKLRLQDCHRPPNMSPLHTVNVEIDARPVSDGEQLRPSHSVTSGHTRGASVRETEVLLLDTHMLHYVHRDGRSVDVTYDVVTSRGFHGSTVSTDGGKLVLLGHGQVNISKSELARLPETKSFRQHQVNARLVAYVPPQRDVGPTLLRVSFQFSVHDRYGTGRLTGQHLNITVFPVNDKPPVMYTGLLVVFKAGSSVISSHALSTVDEDTPDEDLLFTLSQFPNYGTVLLDHVPLAVGHNFTPADVGNSRVTYAHRGAHSPSDRIHLILTDGVHLVTGSVLVHLVPARETENKIAEEKEGLTVNEGDDIIITPEVLMGDSPEDESDSNARFFVVQNPNLGSIQVQGKSNDVFTQDDLVSGRVKYVHNGSVEIGRSSQLDDIHFMLVESGGSVRVHQHGRSGGSDEPIHTLRITILPVDNAAPYLDLGPDVPLVVPEGATVPLGRHVLEALDLDSKTENVALVVARAPIFGYLANVRPARGSAEFSSPILNFKLADLDDETVHYVQSVYDDGAEPKEDSFVLYAMDGKHRSRQVVLNISIIPLNDEPPIVLLKNFTVSQRGDKA